MPSPIFRTQSTLKGCILKMGCRITVHSEKLRENGKTLTRGKKGGKMELKHLATSKGNYYSSKAFIP